MARGRLTTLLLGVLLCLGPAAGSREELGSALVKDGQRTTTRDDGDATYGLVLPMGLTNWGAANVYGDLPARQTLYQRSFRARQYERVMMELVLQPEAQQVDVQSLQSATSALGLSVELSEALRKAVEVGADFRGNYVRGGTLTADLRNELAQWGRQSRNLQGHPAFARACQAVAAAKFVATLADAATAAVLLNALAVDEAAGRLDVLERSLPARGELDPALAQGLAAARVNFEAMWRPGIWPELLRALHERQAEIIEGSVGAAKVAAEIGLKWHLSAGVWLLPLTCEVEIIKALYDTFDHVQLASLSGELAQLLWPAGAKPGLPETVPLAAYGQVMWYSHMEESMSNWLMALGQLVAQSVFPDVPTAKRHYHDGKSRALSFFWRYRGGGPWWLAEVPVTATVYVLDVSGSMSEATPGGVKLESAKRAVSVATQLVQQEAETTRCRHDVALVTFTTRADLRCGMTPDVTVVRSAVDALGASGGTNMGAGLETALEELGGLPPQTTRMIVMLSDGMSNEGMSKGELLSGPVGTAAKEGIAIFACGYGRRGRSNGGGMDEGLLQEIARRTNGAYYYAASGRELEDVFIRFRHESLGEIAGEMTGSIAQGEVSRAGVVSVPGDATSLLVSLNWPGSRLGLRLQDPLGAHVDEGYPGAAMITTSKPVYYIISRPLPGAWVVSVQGIDVPEGTTRYGVIASTRRAGKEPSVSSDDDWSDAAQTPTEKEGSGRGDRGTLMPATCFLGAVGVLLGGYLGWRRWARNRNAKP